ncbi:aldehyde dehydrogenase family protein [Nocardioides sp.]|uniref:aldehyde dehydrogenase family protein n=1 Tax=Nocardioides sp. TaxID=35761 RepID=UPI003219FFD8
MLTDLEAALTELSAGVEKWPAVSLEQRAALLHQVAVAASTTAPDWVAAACRAKQLDSSSSLVGEEWLSGPYPVAMNAATLSHTLSSLASGSAPITPGELGAGPGGRTTVDIFPASIWDRLLLSGFSAKVWMQPGVTPADVLDRAGLAQLDPTRSGGISVVLGAGNITSIAVLDTLYEVVAHNRAVILKLNPVMAEMLPSAVRVLNPLIQAGMVRVVTGGTDVGRALVEHESVTHVHITGSAQSHDAIVFGRGDKGDARRASGKPLLTKTISSELGGVSPTIVVPGRWSKRDLRFQAEHAATQRLHNGGYNCIASQVLVVPAEWDQKDAFLAALRAEIDGAPSRPAYYPGSDSRMAEARSTHASAESRANGRLLLPGLTPGSGAAVFRTEYFSPVLAVVEVPGSGTDYLRAAASFANEQLVGTLGANVIVHPRRRKALGADFESFLESLRFGTIGVNAWTAVGYLTAAAPWGGFPGATLTDVESGIGVVHNALLLDDTERTVVDGPFRPFPRSVLTGQPTITPKPAWFVRNRTAARTAELLVRFVAAPGWRKLPRLFASALRG